MTTSCVTINLFIDVERERERERERESDLELKEYLPPSNNPAYWAWVHENLDP